MHIASHLVLALAKFGKTPATNYTPGPRTRALASAPRCLLPQYSDMVEDCSNCSRANERYFHSYKREMKRRRTLVRSWKRPAIGLVGSHFGGRGNWRARSICADPPLVIVIWTEGVSDPPRLCATKPLMRNSAECCAGRFGTSILLWVWRDSGIDLTRWKGSARDPFH